MKIGALYPSRLPFSAQNYIENIQIGLNNFGVDIIWFKKNEFLPEGVDLYWDPFKSRSGPHKKLLYTTKPYVISYHGAANLTLGLKDCYGNGIKNMIRGYFLKKKTQYEWKRFKNRLKAIIAVSNYAKWEIQNFLGFAGDIIFPIYHGVNFKIFKPDNEVNSNQAYFLHISQYQPIKNVDRIIEAFQRFSYRDRTRLVLVVPRYLVKQKLPPKVELITTPMNQEKLVSLYQHAIAFVFPSLRETFGMPILEAMASGCPVITSNVAGSYEIAGDAALLVNPRSVNEISKAMKSLIEDKFLKQEMRKNGLNHAQKFTWNKSVKEHLKVFKQILKNSV